MSIRSVKLHVKLYRARAIEQALAWAAEQEPAIKLSRRRQGDYQVVETDSDAAGAPELLASVADAALVFTVEQEG